MLDVRCQMLDIRRWVPAEPEVRERPGVLRSLLVGLQEVKGGGPPSEYRHDPPEGLWSFRGILVLDIRC